MLKNQNPMLREILKNIGLITQLGLSVISPILIFVLGFVYLDKKLHTEGKLIIIGVLLGVATGILAAYRLLKKTYKD
ncbi:MAG: AtpZ/AtpI family protein [Candidatus Cloacimonadales bacterium]|nr:AtpZ/AtpI family protein [Candidatus Cloacimonadales bacterium]